MPAATRQCPESRSGRRLSARLRGGSHAPPRARHEERMTLEIYLAYIAAGSQLGLGLMMAILVVGLSSVIAAMGWLFEWLRWAGAAYLIWIGWKLLRSPDSLDQPGAAPTPRGGFLLQGFLVLMANPKALLWFGAFIPQFVDPKGNYVAQIIALGLTAMAIALVTDGGYAVLTGRAGALLSRKRVRLVSRLSGTCLIGGGIWLALTRGR